MAASTFHKASLQRLPTEYKILKTYWLHLNETSKTSNKTLKWLFKCQNVFSFFYLEQLLLIEGLLMLAGQLSDGALWIPFYQQLSSKNSSLLPTWSSSWWGRRVAIRDGNFTSHRWVFNSSGSHWPQFDVGVWWRREPRWHFNIVLRLKPWNPGRNAGIFWLYS